MKPPNRLLLGLVTLAAFALLLGVEFLLFDQLGSHRVTSIYPRWNDQIQYLSEAYTAHEYARSHGVGAAFWKTLVNPSAQGTLHDSAALLLFQLSSPSRSAALALNMLALIAWQVALYIAIRRHSGSRALGIAAALLPLALRGPWLNLPGGAYDFRLDHLGACALGVTSAAAVLANGFRSRTGCIILGIATGLTLLTRFITGTYLVVIFTVFLGWMLIARGGARRLVNLGLSGAIAAALAGPIFWLNREWVWNYYYIGHYVGPESAIRNQNFGIGRSLAFVWGIFAERHVGVFFGVLAGGLIIGFLALKLVERFSQGAAVADVPATDTAPTDAPAPRSAGQLAGLGAIFLLAPALVLTLHPQKSDVVLSALAPGAVLVVIAVWVALGRLAPASAAPLRRARTLLVALAAMAAVGTFGVRQLVPADDPAVIANLRQVNVAADHIFARSHAAHLERPRIAVDYITDALDAQVLRVVCYERHHVWIDFDMRLPTGIAAPEPALVRQRIQESDFVFLIGDDAPFGSFPYDQTLHSLRPELRAWCDANLVPAQRFNFWGHPIILYQRRALE